MTAIDRALFPAPEPRPADRRPPTPLSRLALRVPVLVFLLVVVVLPVGYLFFQAASQGWASLTNQLSQAQLWQAVWLSLKIALWAVPLNAISGVAAALLISRSRWGGTKLLGLLFDLPIALSPIILGIALYAAYSDLGWFGPFLTRHGINLFSVPAMVLASCAMSLPYVLRSVLPVLEELGDEQEQAARTLGASAMRRLWTITLPTIRWAVLYGVALTLARVLGEYGAVLIVSGNQPGVSQSLSLYIGASYDSNNPKAALTAAVLLAACSMVILVVLAALNRREKRILVDQP